MKTETDRTVTIMKALADTMRLAIVRSLVRLDGPARSCDIVEACASCGELSQPAMSHHFKKLADAGIVTVKKAGSENIYSLERQLLATAGIDAGKL